MVHRMEVLSPLALSQGDQDRAQVTGPLAALDSKCLGLLWNGKRGGDVALRRAGELLAQRVRNLRVVFFEGTGSEPTSPGVMDQIKRECDVILGSTAD